MQECSNDEINLLDYLEVVKKRKKSITILVAVVTLATIVASLLMPKYYMAEAVILPIQSSQTDRFSSLASLVGMGGGGVIKPAQQLMVLLQSYTLAERMVKKYKLMPEKGQSLHSAVVDLLGHVQFENDEITGVIKIQAEYKDPKFSAKMANRYVESLQDFIRERSFTSARKNKLFVKGQLIKNKRELLNAGTELGEFYKRGSSVGSKIDVFVGEDDVSVEEVPDLGLEVLDEELIENVVEKKKDDGSMYVRGVSQQVYYQYLSAHRSSLAQLNALLVQQYEMAKIEEVKDNLAFQIVDSARVPEKPV